jgi:hypothetical protein
VGRVGGFVTNRVVCDEIDWICSTDEMKSLYKMLVGDTR